ncbi:MAG: hypothetical protein GXY43_07065 [Clostridiaceae bacterium]|nr:hypothetical protein [Clostridiaceae bacterium]
MWKKRLIVSLVCGAILGVFCIIGASIRFEGQADWMNLFSLWYNRLLMGLLIGMCVPCDKLISAIGRGALLGLAVSFAFFATTGFTDIVSFLAGVVYGMIIEVVTYRIGLSKA